MPRFGDHADEVLRVIGRLAALAGASLLGAILHSPLRAAELPPPPGYALRAGEPVWLTGGTHGLSEGAAVAASLAVVTFLVLRPRPAHTRPARV